MVSTTQGSKPWSKRQARRSRSLWLKGLESLMVLVALVNLGLVVFDFSYIRLRDFYLRYLPQVTQSYDPIKGIEPHYDTQAYLDAVNQLDLAIAQQGLDSPAVATQLASLRDRSADMIDEDPFQLADKSGTLEKIKNRMREHMGNESATQSFAQFWSLSYLQAQSWQTARRYFDRNIEPLIASNYYRPIDESGQFVDRFWVIDGWFVGLFAADILLRTIWIQRRHRMRWRDALLWRWYDLLLLLPFWRILRVLPVALRLHQVGWINLNSIQAQVSRNLAENLAGEVTELVLIQTFNLVQSIVRQGAVRNFLLEPQEMVDTNDIDELDLIFRHIVVSLANVLPTLQPQLEALLNHTVKQALIQASVYQSIKFLPGVEQLSTELASQIGHQVIQAISETLKVSINDERGKELTRQLGDNFLTNLRREVEQRDTLNEVESLLATWLEELKLTMLKRLDTEDAEQTLQEAEQIRWVRQSSTVELLPSPRQR